MTTAILSKTRCGRVLRQVLRPGPSAENAVGQAGCIPATLTYVTRRLGLPAPPARPQTLTADFHERPGRRTDGRAAARSVGCRGELPGRAQPFRKRWRGRSGFRREWKGGVHQPDPTMNGHSRLLRDLANPALALGDRYVIAIEDGDTDAVLDVMAEAHGDARAMYQIRETCILCGLPPPPIPAG